MGATTRTVPATLIFDGQCGFCRWSLDHLSHLLPVRPEFLASQSADLTSYGLTQPQVDAAAWWVDSAGAHGGHLVLARWLLASGRPWSLFGWFLTLPPVSPAAALTYRWIARNRFRLRGPWSGTCHIPSPQLPVAPARRGQHLPHL